MADLQGENILLENPWHQLHSLGICSSIYRVSLLLLSTAILLVICLPWGACSLAAFAQVSSRRRTCKVLLSGERSGKPLGVVCSPSSHAVSSRSVASFPLTPTIRLLPSLPCYSQAAAGNSTSRGTLQSLCSIAVLSISINCIYPYRDQRSLLLWFSVGSFPAVAVF